MPIDFLASSDSVFNSLRLLGGSAKGREATISFVMSVCWFVCPHGTTWFPTDGFSKNVKLFVVGVVSVIHVGRLQGAECKQFIRVLDVPSCSVS